MRQIDSARDEMNTHALSYENGGSISSCGREEEQPTVAELASIDATAPPFSPRSFGDMVNLQELMERIDHDRELLREVFELFRDELPVLHSDLKVAARSGCLLRIQGKAHTLKGMFANLAVTQATAIAAEIEQMARIGDQCGLTDALASLDGEVSSLLPCVEGFLSGDPQ